MENVDREALVEFITNFNNHRKTAISFNMKTVEKLHTEHAENHVDDMAEASIRILEESAILSSEMKQFPLANMSAEYIHALTTPQIIEALQRHAIELSVSLAMRNFNKSYATASKRLVTAIMNSLYEAGAPHYLPDPKHPLE